MCHHQLGSRRVTHAPGRTVSVHCMGRSGKQSCKVLVMISPRSLPLFYDAAGQQNVKIKEGPEQATHMGPCGVQVSGTALGWTTPQWDDTWSYRMR